jgi:lysozyme family protein
MANDQDFERAVRLLFATEGGFCNHPADPGGATNDGISLRFLLSLHDYDLGDIDKDGDIDIDDIKLLSTSDAEKIYKKYFWDKFPMNGIPAPLAYVVFDISVNSGHGVAAKDLQKVLGMVPDGVLGSKTLYAISQTDPMVIAGRMLDMRIQQYTNYVLADHKKSVFLKGWLNRVKQVRGQLSQFA